MAFQEIDWRDLVDGGDSVENVLDKFQQNIREAYNRAYEIKSESVFARGGSLVVTEGKGRQYIWTKGNIVGVRASVDGSPTGSSIVIDVNKNGDSVYTTQENRPTIDPYQNTVLAPLPDISSFVEGDYLTLDIDAIGNTNPGRDLTVQILYQSE